MNYNGVHEIWDTLWEEIGEEYLIHRSKYENWGWAWRSYDWVWNGVEEWIRKRPNCYLKHMKDFYGVSSSVSSTLASEDDYTITDLNGRVRYKGLSKGIYILKKKEVQRKS